MADGEDVSQLVTGGFDGSVLDLTSNFRSEISNRFVLMCEIWMVSGITLNANSPTLLGHSKDKGPTVFWIKVSIGEYKQALVLLKLNVLLQVIKNLPSMELFHSCVRSHPSLHNLLSFKHIKTAF